MPAARNHCAATMLTNAVMLLCPENPRCQDAREIFTEVHAVVGNGPVLRLEHKANRYLREAALPFQCEQIDRHLTEASPDRLVRIAQESLCASSPVALLVAASPLRWHWVLALPEGQSGGGLLISDTWHARQAYRYIPDRGSRLMAVCVFHPHAI